MLFTVVLSLTCISVVFARKHTMKKLCDSMERGSIEESKNSTRWPCTLVEGERGMVGESMVSF
jgi:hypothetical protein